MLNKEQIKGFIKEHKKEILIAGGIIVSGAVLGKVCVYKKNTPKLKHKVVFKTDSREFKDALYELIDWGSGVETGGAYIGYGLTDEHLREVISEHMDSNDSGDYLYSMVLERINKDKLK